MPWLDRKTVDYLKWEIGTQAIWKFRNFQHVCELLGDDELRETAIKLHADYFHLARREEALVKAILWRLDHQKGETTATPDAGEGDAS